MSDESLRAPIQEFLQYLAVQKNASGLTVKSYGEDLEGWLEYSLELRNGDLPAPDKITTPELRGYLAAMTEAEYAKSTICRRLASLRSFFRFCQRQGIVTENPAAPLRNPKSGRSLPRFLTTDEISKLLNAPSAKSWSGIRDRAILEVIYSAGLRVSELTGLNVGDLLLDEELIRVRGKGKKERFGLLGGYAVESLLKWLDVRPKIAKRSKKGPPSLEKRQKGADIDPPVFLNPQGNRLSTRSVARMLDKYLAVSGLNRKATPHSLRHSFATHLLNAGADIRSIQELLGHKKLMTTQVYTHINAAMMKEAYLKAHPRSQE